MDLEAVMEELAEALRAIPSLTGRTFGFPADSVTPPAAIVGYPEGTFDLTYQRGTDRMTFPVWVVVGKVSDRAARSALGPYISGAGDSSVKAAIDEGAYTELDVATANSWTVTQITLADGPYLAAEFSVDVVGSGE